MSTEPKTYASGLDPRNHDVGSDILYEIRADVESQFVRGLLTINGGGAVASLAFAQAVLVDNHNLARAALLASLCFGVGIFFAALVNLFRYLVALAAKHLKESRRVLCLGFS